MRLIKLCVVEAESERVHTEVAAAQELAVALVSYAEARAALAALWRAKRLGATAQRAAKQSLDRDWAGFRKVALTEVLCREAGEMAETFGLRGYDSIQLASFAQLARAVGPDAIAFCGFDRRLSAAADTWVKALRRRH